jgi:prepilin-type N-terminal cleavage/methylation domain-containing protein
MKTTMAAKRSKKPDGSCSDKGFTLIEFLFSSLVLLVVTSAAFTMLAETQQTTGFQSEIQAVVNNTRIAMQTVERHLRQAGNDPLNTGLSGLSGLVLLDTDKIQIRSDLKGSFGPVSPNKGDPDGDINDSDENIILRFNPSSSSIEIVPEGGPPRIIANYITSFSVELFDETGNSAVSDDDTRKVAVFITGSSRGPDPRTGDLFSFTLHSVIRPFY